MDWLTFVSKLFETAAWPVVVLGIFLLLRKPLCEAARAWETIKATYKDFAVELRKAKEEAEKASLPVSPLVTSSYSDESVESSSSYPPSSSSHPSSRRSEPLLDKYERLIEVSPAAGVVEAWRDVEVELLRLAEGRAIATGKSLTVAVLSQLEAADALDSRSAQIIQRLRRLRNEAAHHTTRPISHDDAMEYAMLATRIIARLQEGRE
jgi:hypothetical protein